MTTPQATIRMLPGVYLLGLTFTEPLASPTIIVASGATIASITPLSVKEGADVRLRGASLVAQDFAVDCVNANVTILDADLTSTNNSVLTGGACQISIARSKLSANDRAVIALATDSSLVGDRLHITGTKAAIATIFKNVQLEITNSVLDDPLILLNTSDTSPPGSSAVFAFNTVVLRSQSSQILCSGLSANLDVRFENNILVADGTQMPSVVDGSECELVNNIIHPQLGIPATNFDVDPMFVDAANNNFRVLSTSAAVDAADDTASVVPDHDFTGSSRPQGAGHDIGAFEQ